MHDYVRALLGGATMGVACALLYAMNGKILGISGVLGGALKVRSRDAEWRWAFLAGMLTAGTVALIAVPSAFTDTVGRTAIASVAAGGLVGVGTQLGSGCTSGHGICGIGRLSKRSIAATLVFMGFGGIAVTMIRVGLNGAI